MAKKVKEEPVPTTNSVQNRDIIQRLNYMYQAGAFLQSLHAQAESSTSGHNAGHSEHSASKNTRSQRKKTSGTAKPLKTMGDLGRSYVRSMKVVGQRTTVKMDPSIKRTICKGCDVALVPGLTVSTRVEKLPSHGHAMVYTCLNCRTKRRIPAPPVASPLPPLPVPALPGPNVEAQPLIGDIATAMDAQEKSEVPSTLPPVRKKRGPQPRQPLLAARKDAGHVIFCGSVKLLDEDGP